MLKRLLLAGAFAVLPLLSANADVVITPGPGFLFSTKGCDYLWLPGLGWGSFRAGTMNAGGTDAQNVQKVQEWSGIIQSIQMANANIPAANQMTLYVANSGQDALVCGNYSIITGLIR